MTCGNRCANICVQTMDADGHLIKSHVQVNTRTKTSNKQATFVEMIHKQMPN